MNASVSQSELKDVFLLEKKATENGRQKTRFVAELTPGEFRMSLLPENGYYLKIFNLNSKGKLGLNAMKT